ncbi:ead/Ea22-like family protein [Cronobacter turicensis]
MNIAKLKAAALAATPGEWCPDDHHGVIADAGLNANFYIASCSGPEHKANKRFIAAANPAAVLELIAALEAAEKRNAELTDALKQAVSGYKSCLRTGHERIVELGGECDDPETMIADNPDIRQAEKVLSAGINLETGGEA